MKKSIQYIIVAVLLAACSGCFPVFVPAGGERGGGRHGGHHDEGRHNGRR